jgi:hypothetical protein
MKKTGSNKKNKNNLEKEIIKLSKLLSGNNCDGCGDGSDSANGETSHGGGGDGKSVQVGTGGREEKEDIKENSSNATKPSPAPTTLLKMNEIESQLTEYGKTLTNDTSMITSAVNFTCKEVIPAIHEKIKKMGQNDVISILKRALSTRLKRLQAESSTTAAMLLCHHNVE